MTDKPVRWSPFMTALAVLGALVMPHLSLAHPLGNFSISHYTAIRLEPDAVVLRYIIDMAEIPTFQEIQRMRIVPQEGHPGLPAYLAQRVDELRSGLSLELNGRRLPLSSESSEVIFPPGAGGLPTLKLGMRLRARLDGASAATVYELRYRDINFPGRAGWKEVIATAGQEIMLLSSTVPERDRSRELAEYPADLLNSPPQAVEARVIFARQVLASDPVTVGSLTARSPGATGATQGQWSSSPQKGEDRVSRQKTPRNSFTELVAAPQLELGIVLAAVAVSVGLGAFHALEPGHGKALVAAYLVGSQGTAWHALMLGLIVTVTHTAGVYLLGVVTLFASRYVVPERLYPWLGVTSGLIIAGLGATLFLRRYIAAGHEHGHGHLHSHTHGHGRAEHHTHHLQHHRAPSMVSGRELLALGVTGGIVPCPAALVVLLSALAFNRVGFGLMLIVAFSLGLATVIIAIGILMVYAHRLMSWLQGDGVLMARWLPLGSATAVTLFGVAIAVQALINAGILQIRL